MGPAEQVCLFVLPITLRVLLIVIFTIIYNFYPYRTGLINIYYHKPKHCEETYRNNHSKWQQ